MRGRCVWLREISPGEREMATSGGEREERQAWTHDTNGYVQQDNSPCHKAQIMSDSFLEHGNVTMTM